MVKSVKKRPEVKEELMEELKGKRRWEEMKRVVLEVVVGEEWEREVERAFEGMKQGGARAKVFRRRVEWVGKVCGVSKAEERVKRAYRRLTGGTIKWLEEHADLGLPNPARVYSHFKEQVRDTHRVRRSGNATLFLWEWMWKVLMCNWPGRGNAVFQMLLRWLVPVLSRIHLGRCYRTMIWIEPRDQ